MAWGPDSGSLFADRRPDRGNTIQNTFDNLNVHKRDIGIYPVEFRNRNVTFWSQENRFQSLGPISMPRHTILNNTWRTLMRRVTLLPINVLTTVLLSSLQSLTSSLMSHTHPTSTSYFKPIFDTALKEYTKRTNNDLLTHPLADRLNACDSANNILTVLQELAPELNQSQRSNTNWLDPIVNVLLAFSGTLGEGVGSVCFRT